MTLKDLKIIARDLGCEINVQYHRDGLLVGVCAPEGTAFAGTSPWVMAGFHSDGTPGEGEQEYIKFRMSRGLRRLHEGERR